MLNDDYELDRIESNNRTTFEEHSVQLFKKLDDNSCPLYLDKLTFHHFACCVVMRRKHEGEKYSTSYYNIMSTALIQMYCTAKADMPEYFRV